jgi:hypothetical protein
MIVLVGWAKSPRVPRRAGVERLCADKPMARIYGPCVRLLGIKGAFGSWHIMSRLETESLIGGASAGWVSLRARR